MNGQTLQIIINTQFNIKEDKLTNILKNYVCSLDIYISSLYVYWLKFWRVILSESHPVRSVCMSIHRVQSPPRTLISCEGQVCSITKWTYSCDQDCIRKEGNSTITWNSDAIQRYRVKVTYMPLVRWFSQRYSSSTVSMVAKKRCEDKEQNASSPTDCSLQIALLPAAQSVFSAMTESQNREITHIHWANSNWVGP